MRDGQESPTRLPFRGRSDAVADPPAACEGGLRLVAQQLVAQHSVNEDEPAAGAVA
jgi:hypothetical protein